MPRARSDLSSNVLRGPLPASLGSLTRLTSLCVSRARARSAAPAWHCDTEHPPGARSSVSGNIIYGTLPDSFSSLTALQTL